MPTANIKTPELLKRKGIKIKIVQNKLILRAVNIPPIETMYERGSVTIAQLSAANELYRCWVLGWGERGSCEIRERVDGGSKAPEMTTKQVHAIKEFERGKKAMIKLNTWDIINQVVINEIFPTKKGMGETERRKIMFWLRQGLDELAKCYAFK